MKKTIKQKKEKVFDEEQILFLKNCMKFFKKCSKQNNSILKCYEIDSFLLVYHDVKV